MQCGVPFRHSRNKKKPGQRPGFNNARNRGSCSASFGVTPHLGGAAATLNRHEYLIDVVLQIRYPFWGGTYISIPPMPPGGMPPPWLCSSSFGASAIITSVVSNRQDTDAAFCTARREPL